MIYGPPHSKMRPSLAKKTEMFSVLLIFTSARTRHAHCPGEASQAFTANERAFYPGKSVSDPLGCPAQALERGSGFLVFGREPFPCAKRGASNVRGAEPLPPSAPPAVPAGRGARLLVGCAYGCPAREAGGLRCQL